MKSIFSIIKKIALIAVVFIGAIFLFVVSKTKSSKPYNAAPIIERCFQTYEESGMTGLQILSQKLYADFDSSPSMDVITQAGLVDTFSYKLDESLTRTYPEIPKNQYFTEQALKERIQSKLGPKGFSDRKVDIAMRLWDRLTFFEIQRQLNRNTKNK